MQHIPLLFVLVAMSTVSCVASTEELLIEAKECVAQSTNEQGVIGASKEQQTACWVPVNERLASIAKREARLEAEEANRCPNGYVKYCDWTGCGCITNYEFREMMRRMRF